MTPRARLALVLMVCGCATLDAPAPKLSFDEAMGWHATQERTKAAPIEDPHASKTLAAAMTQFTEAARVARKNVERGAAMPPAHVEAWNVVLTEVEHFVVVAPKQSSVLDTIRTRLRLQTEFENDGSTYGDVPMPLTDRVQHALQSLAVKLAAQTPRRLAPIKLQWPLSPVVVTSAYGDRLHPIHGEHRFHAGADLAADAFQSVYAAEAGTVMFCGWNGGHGKQIELQHDGHLSTRYSHLESLLVRNGQRVKRGELLGLAGQTGLATGVHLHFEVVRDGEALDPEFVLDGPGAVAGRE